MKNILLILIFIPTILFSQTKTNIESKRIVENSDFEQVKGRTIKGETYIPFLAKVNATYNENELPENILQGSKSGDIVTLYIKKTSAKSIADLNIAGVDYIEIAKSMSPHLKKAVRDTRVDSVHAGYTLPQPYTGKNVLIGICDWGFDYTNPMFYDTLLEHTRILKAWDQFRTGPTPPNGFLYGREISGEENLLDAQSDTFNLYEYPTHGSHVAGIAGGSGAGTQYRGIAFESNFLFATFIVDAAAVLDAYNWMKNCSEELDRRLVINQSWGLYNMGNYDGTSLLSTAIDNLSEEGIVFVSSAGNNGNVNFHLKYDPSEHDTLNTVIEFDNYSYYPKMWGQCVTMWGEQNNSFEINMRVLDASQNVLNETNFIKTDSRSYSYDTLFVNADTIYYNITIDSSDAQSQRPYMKLRVANRNTAYKIALQVHSDSGIVHLWNIIELTNDAGNWGSDFKADFDGYVGGDDSYGIGEPTCSKSCITVAAHNSESVSSSGTAYPGAIANFSSKGPLIDGTIKPDISAPGVGVISSTSSFTSETISTVTTTVDFNGRTYKFTPFSGTSMSSPMVTGVIALMLEANPNLSADEIKQILKNTARTDSKTGEIPETGSTTWGWGKINALHAIYNALGLTEIYENSDNTFLKVFPNPTSGIINIKHSDNQQINKINIISVDGKILKTTQIFNNQFDISEFPFGIYFIQISDCVDENIYPIVKE